jgi:hypothetical protein
LGLFSPLAERRNTVIEAVMLDPCYVLLVDQYGPMKVIHGDAFYWSHTIAKRFRAEFQKWFEEQKEPIFIAQIADGRKTVSTKFAKFLGFTEFTRGYYLGMPANYFLKVK